MKTINRLLTLSIFIPFLMGCTNKSSYNGPKIILDYVSEGALLTVDASKMYEDVVTNKKSTIYLLGNDTCSSCQKVKDNILEPYAKGSHCNIYYIDIANANETDFNKIQASTKGMYQFLEKDTVPATFFFYEGEVAFRIGANEDLGHYLEQYVEVAPNN